jgi:hypothetical protein
MKKKRKRKRKKKSIDLPALLCGKDKDIRWLISGGHQKPIKGARRRLCVTLVPSRTENCQSPSFSGHGRPFLLLFEL